MRLGTSAFVWVVCGFLGLAGGLTSASAEGVLDGAQFRKMIQGQMEAFRRNDAAGAFAFATTGLQKQFQSPDIFIAMVKQGYLPVFRPREVSFGRLKETPQGPVQEVFVTGPDGDNWVALYSFARQEDGSWGISGCVLRKDKGTAA
ncbi:DUF4864 domain-containing protein [Microvirga tunisiensis]|uniref:DUF4864 domain-containing protein n=2 Tax=Pannonibacter tanglangensis TaxID=2750084 RepID=A0ABW9ZBJ6_9HYPH|nr:MULTISPECIES: DUF4864 domain-containing protein [unclassified Pannonibacter]NBN62194.1 DUF4864 domain-containing protein [Pannonibacter sp. XCT-34]NBN77862.1 DUF4864 domain-containing protein [Pannonibacter sp. XCT-53]